MLKVIFKWAFMFGAMLTATSLTFAHHSRAMFDVAKNVTYRGVVKEYQWQNPHSQIVIVATDPIDNTKVETWDIEASSISIMQAMGWNPTILKPGDPITVVGHPNIDGSNKVLLFYLVMENGTRLYRAKHRYPLESE